MKELSIFIDESGNFGEYDYHSPYYIVSFVFHKQAADLFCYFTLVELKCERKSLSLIETRFFESYRQLRRNYLKQVSKYKF